MVKAYHGFILMACSVCFYVLYMSGLMSWKNGLGVKWGAIGLVQPWSNKSIDRNRTMKDNQNLIDLRNTENCVLAFIHIQKAGGTNFEKLLTDIEGLECRCPVKKRLGNCKCLRSKGDPWIVMRYVGFGMMKSWPCGLHPDYTMLKKCIPKLMHDSFGTDFNPRVLFFTLLRDPVQRYLSEFRHVQRGAAWRNAKMKCRSEEKCYDGWNWTGVSLKNFMACKWNPANNRQTRMLADLRFLKCNDFYKMSKEKRDNLLFDSATRVLKNMAFFSLTEKPAESQFIFEKTFNVKFNKEWKLFRTGYSKEYMKNMSHVDIQKIEDINYLDMKLYNFALSLFAKRLAYLEELFLEKPKKTRVIQHKKDKIVLQKNWKNKRMKVKTRETKLDGKKRKRAKSWWSRKQKYTWVKGTHQFR